MQLDALLVLRALWATLPLTLGTALDEALAPASTPVAATAVVGAWVLWAVVLLALLVPRVASLTALRIGVPAVVAAAVVAAVRSGVSVADLVAVGTAALLAVVAAWPTVADRLVDGSSYGPERRLPLRVPPAVALGAAPLAVAVTLAGVSVGPLLLAARQWLVGGVVTGVGLALAVAAVRSLHGLSRRFLVLVPGGLVVHDPFTLVDPVLLPRGALVSVGPAPADTDAVDLTLGAGGLLVEARLGRADDLVLRHPGRRPDEAVTTAAVLVAPTRPGTVLAEARAHGLPVPG